MTYDKEKLLKIVKKNEQSEIACLERLIAIPTCYGKGHDMKPVIAQLNEEFEKRGYKVRTFPTSGAPVVVAEMDLAMDKTLLFYNHYDVQPEEPLDEWKSPPFDLKSRNGRLYGRGVVDNKGPLVANIFGTQAALESGCELKCNVRFIIEGEEETGGLGLEEFCNANPGLLESDGCVWEGASAVPQQRSEVYAGAKGCVYFELRAKGFAVDAHSGDAPVVINPAWRLVWALSTLKNQNEEILIDGYYDDVVSPKEEELQLFKQYPPDAIDPYKQTYKTETFLLGRKGVEFWKELCLRPTCTICGLSSGWTGSGAKTIVPKEAMAKVDFRIVPNQKVERVQKLLREHLDKKGFPDIEIKLVSGAYGASKTPFDHPFVELLANLAKDFSGKNPLIIPSAGSSGPAYLFGKHTPWAMCGLVDPEHNAHAPNESMSITELRHMTALIGATAIELGTKKVARLDAY
ncbi:MAG: M20/M25/M40 family metallo-hydrolase [Candidatus Bathyarchaeia archaeon]